MEIKDSGERRVFKTGAQRDRGKGKGRPSLNPVRAEQECSILFEDGAEKYEAWNWSKGMNLDEYCDSLRRHYKGFMCEDISEPHLVQLYWNVSCLLDTLLRIEEGILPPELIGDLPFKKIRLMNGRVLTLNKEKNTIEIEYPDGKSVTKVWEPEETKAAAEYFVPRVTVMTADGPISQNSRENRTGMYSKEATIGRLQPNVRR